MYLDAPPSSDYAAILERVKNAVAQHKASMALGEYQDLGRFKIRRIIRAPIKIAKKVVKAHVKVAKKAVKVVKKVAPYVAIAAAVYFGGPYVIAALKAGGAKAAGIINMYTQKRTDEGATPESIAQEIAQMQNTGAPPVQSLPVNIAPQMYTQPNQQSYQPMYERPTQADTPAPATSSMPPWLLPAIAIGATLLLRS